MEKTGFTKGVFVKKDYNNYGDKLYPYQLKLKISKVILFQIKVTYILIF